MQLLLVSACRSRKYTDNTCKVVYHAVWTGCIKHAHVKKDLCMRNKLAALDAHKCTPRQKCSQREVHQCRVNDTQINSQTDKSTYRLRQTNMQTHKQTDRQRHRLKDMQYVYQKQADIQSAWQTSTQAGRQKTSSLPHMCMVASIRNDGCVQRAVLGGLHKHMYVSVNQQHFNEVVTHAYHSSWDTLSTAT